MAGRPFKVGRFAHTLRVRLMREHLGIDVDALSEEDLMTHQASKSEYQQQPWEPDLEQEGGKEGASKTTFAETGKVFQHESPTHGIEGRTLNEEHKDFNKRHPKNQTDDNKNEVTSGDQIFVEESESGSLQRTEPVNVPRTEDHVLLGVPANHKSPDGNEDRARSLRSDVDGTASTRATTRANFGSKPGRQPWTVPTMKPKVELQDFEDPISDHFWKNIWVASAVHNVSVFSWSSSIHVTCCADHPLQTEIYRKVFHAVPDDLVATWKQYREFVAYHERLNKPVCLSSIGLYRF